MHHLGGEGGGMANPRSPTAFSLSRVGMSGILHMYSMWPKVLPHVKKIPI